MYWLRKNHYPTYEIIGTEDHIIEYSQFFFFLIAGIISIIVSFKFRTVNKAMFAIFLIVSIGLIFVAGEEISWGERIFNIESHEIFDGKTKIPVLKYNVQGEMNLHNFKPIHKAIGYIYLLVGSYFVFSWLVVKLIFKKYHANKKLKSFLSFLIPSPILMTYFLPTAINLFDIEKVGIAPQDYEMVEFLLSLGILIFLVIILRKQQRQTKGEKN